MDENRIDKTVYGRTVNCFFFNFVALAFAFLSARHTVTQLIVFSEPIDCNVTFRDGGSYVE